MYEISNMLSLDENAPKRWKRFGHLIKLRLNPGQLMPT
jgi:hypothetical protein